jgi:hypothetical protein
LGVQLPCIVPLAESLILTLAENLKPWAFRLRNRPLLLVFDGFAAYVTAFRTVFRCALLNGAQGRPPLVAWPNILLGQVIKRRVCRRLVAIERRIVQGPRAVIDHLISSSQGGKGVLNTAYIERLNAIPQAE